ncbi:MAG: response regulator transcription factor [Verrucomicrobiota bacterium]
MNSSEPPSVLVVDDEPQIQRLLKLTLESNGFRALLAAGGQEALVLATQHRPSVILLDLGLPDLTGREVLRRLREWSSVPVVILTAQDSETEKVAALDEGADDYVTKPFNTGELLARLRVALRHASRDPEPPVFQSGGLVVDLSARRVTVQGREILLTATEYSLLRFLVRHSGKVLTHRMILREIWGPASETQSHYLRVYVARLRTKLGGNDAGSEWIRTEPGVGYRLLEASRAKE